MEKRDFMKDFARTIKDAFTNNKSFAVVIEESDGIRMIGSALEKDKMLEVLSNAVLLHLEQEPKYTNKFIDQYIKQLEKRRI